MCVILQDIGNVMNLYGFKNLKTKFNNSILKYSINAALLFAVLIVFLDKNVLNEYRYFFENLNIKRIDSALAEFSLSIKSASHLSQMLSLVLVSVNLFLLVSEVKSFLMIYAFYIHKICITKIKFIFKRQAINTASKKAVYIIQSKLIC